MVIKEKGKQGKACELFKKYTHPPPLLFFFFKCILIQLRLKNKEKKGTKKVFNKTRMLASLDTLYCGLS